MTSISLSQINYVLALEKTGNFSKAAEQCFVTQSTLSTMIKKLEDQLELKLFYRQYKRVTLTPEGEKLLPQFKIIENEYHNLIDLCNQTKNIFNATIKVGIIPTLAPFLIPLFLDNITKKYPQLKLEIHELTTNDIIKNLKLREIDLGLLSIPLKEPEILQTSLFKEEFLVYDTRKILSKSKKYRIKDIDIAHLWLLEESHCMTSQIGKICELKKDHQQDGNIKFTSGSVLSLLEIVKLKNGITLLPKLATLNKQIINPKCIYELERSTPVRDIGVAVHKAFNKKKIQQLFEEEIRAAVKPYLDTTGKIRDINPF